MRNLFSQESRLVAFLNRMADLVLLNIVHTLVCLPLVTVGAAGTALYTACFTMGTDREGSLLRTYFEAFRSAWKQSTGLWLLLALLETAAVVDALVFYRMPGPERYAYLAFSVAAVLLAMMLCMSFPLISRFQNTWRGTLHNTLKLSLARLPAALAVTLLQSLPLLILFLNPILCLKLGWLWLLIYPAASTYASTRLLRPTFRLLSET